MATASDLPLVLREHAQSIIELDTETATALANHPLAHVSVAPHPEGWAVKPGSVVGAFSVNERGLLIRPKIPMANVFNLLEVGSSSLRWLDSSFDYGTDDNLLVALVRMFRRGLDAAIAHGVRHDYLEQGDRLISLRGRIDMPTLVRRPGLVSPIPCRFDEYTPDIELNRVLVAALLVSLRIPHVPDADRMQLRRHLGRFEGVSALTADLSWVDSWQPSRLEQHYESAVRTAALLLRGRSPADRSGSHTLGQFLVDMNELVETFITERIRRGLPGGLTASAQHQLILDTAQSRVVRPDLVISDADGPMLVLDVKYKALESITSVSTDDLYQLHTYAQLLDLKRAVILSCVATDDELPAPESLTVSKTGIEVELWPIDLQGSAKDLNGQIDLVIERICAVDRLSSICPAG